MKYAAALFVLLSHPAFAETPCESALAYVNLVDEQQAERLGLIGDVRDELSPGIPMLSTDAMGHWYSKVSTALGLVSLHEIKASRKRMKAVKSLSEACR